jgi:NAD(P)H-flavin reductase
MRSVVECVRRHRADYGPVTLLLGVRDHDHLAFADELPAWERDQIDVHVTLSQGDAAWQGRKGRVQLHLPSGDLSNTVAFLVGQREMVADVIAELQRRGLPREQVFLNI